MVVASGWNLWVWLECIGVISGCCCKEVYRYPHYITYPYSTCISSLLCSFLKWFLFFRTRYVQQFSIVLQFKIILTYSTMF